MLSLVADYNTTSSSSSEEDDTDNEDAEQKKSEVDNSRTASTPLLLPSANVILGSGSSKLVGEVFSNPFLEAEKLEIDKLQKHVKMVESENHLLQKNGRKICWNNRKGSCRFGNKCKYAHDSDLAEAKEINNRQIINKEISANAITMESDEVKVPRKRPGLGDSIVPGKRVLKTYQNTKKLTL